MPFGPCGCRAGGDDGARRHLGARSRRMADARQAAGMRNARTTVLITGFGPFPGVPVNATMRLVPELAQAARAGDLRECASPARCWRRNGRRRRGGSSRCWPRSSPISSCISACRHARAASRSRPAPATRARPRPMPPARCRPGVAVRDGGAEFMAASLPVQHIVGPAAPARHPGVRVARCRRLSVQRHALSFARLRARGAGPPRRVHPRAGSLGRTGGDNRRRFGARTLTWEQAHAGGLEILAACLGPGARNVARASRLGRAIAKTQHMPRSNGCWVMRFA